MSNRARTAGLLAGGVLGALAARRLRPGMPLLGKVVLITGGSRGLGFAIARECAAQGARLVLCARNAEQVEAAAAELRAGGAEAVGLPCDVTDAEAVQELVDAAVEHYGALDAVVATAGLLVVGPAAVQTTDDVRDALDVMLWGVLHCALAALPHLRASGDGRLVVITSVGGKLSAPHLLPYNIAKHAAVGLAEGLCAELAGSGVRVTTVVPGLMRTGSHINALMRGRPAAEYRWFGLAATLPVISMSPERAARRIVAALRRGDAGIVVGWPAMVAVRVQGLLPGLFPRVAGVVSRLLPDAPPAAREEAKGRDTGVDLSPWDVLARRPARQLRQ